VSESETSTQSEMALSRNGGGTGMNVER